MALVLVPTVGLTTPTTGLGPTAAQASTPSSAELEEAIRFRSEMGLASDPSVVRRVLETERVSPVFAMAVTQEEESLLLARGRIQSELDMRAFRINHRSVLGGIWLSYPLGGTLEHALTINVALTATDPALAAELASSIPYGADLVFHEARSTESDLDALHPVIAGDLAFFRSIGTKFYSAFTDVRENAVVIVVPSADGEIEAAIRDRFGPDKTRVRVGGPVRPDVCTRANCGPPWRGGLRIAKSGGSCTSNFIMRKYFPPAWSYAMWTAGHCGSAQWRMGSTSGPIIGTTGANYFADGSDADVQVIPIATSKADDDYLAGAAACNPCPMVDVRASEGKDIDEVGEQIRNSGAFSGTKTGIVHSTNFTFSWEEEGVILLRHRLGTYLRMPGDSGGPVTALSAGAYDVAAGSHTHYEDIAGTRYAVYSHVAEMEEKTGWSVYMTGD